MTDRCQWGVTGFVGPNWTGIQCDGEKIHGYRTKLDDASGTATEYHHGNVTFGVYWNEGDENAVGPDDLMKPPPVESDPEDPELSATECFVIQVDNYENAEVLAVAMSKAARDTFLRVYNLNRHTDAAKAVRTTLLVG